MASRKDLTSLKIDTTVKLPSESGFTPQALAFASTGTRYVICSGTSPNHVLKCSASKYTDLGKKISAGHANGATYCEVDGCIYTTAYKDSGDSNSKKVYKFNSKTWKKEGTVTLAGHTVSGIAYDSTTGYFYLGNKSTIYVYKYKDIADCGTVNNNKIVKQFNKGFQDSQSHQNLGGHNGIVMSCRSYTTGVVSYGKNQTSYIDCYDAGTGQYIKSFKRDNDGELESVAIDSSGHMHILFAQNRKLCKTTNVFNLKGTLVGGLAGVKPGLETTLTPEAVGKMVVKEARKYIGEDGTRFYQHTGLSVGSAWCVAFVYSIFDFCTIKENCFNISGSDMWVVTNPENWLKNNGTTIYTRGGSTADFKKANPGDIVIYSWNGDNTRDHIEIVTTTPTGSTIKSIGGNTGPTPGKVAEQSRNKSAVYAIYRPPYTGVNPGAVIGVPVSADVLYRSDNYHFSNHNSVPGEHLYDNLSETFKRTVQFSPDGVSDSESNVNLINALSGSFTSNRLPNTRFRGDILAPKLPTPLSFVEAPFAKIQLGGVTFGIKKDNGGPNYVNGVKVEKTNTTMNLYTISLTHQISPGDNPNYIDELLSKNGYNEIGIVYGDAEGGIEYSDKKALLTNVETSFDIPGNKINYTLKAVSNIIMGSTYKKNYASAYDKPSTLIWDAIYHDDNSVLLDMFPGMSNPTVVASNNWIPTNDIAINTGTYTNISPLNYVKDMVNLMNNGISSDINIKDSVYIMSVNDSDSGAYFKIDEIKTAQDISLQDCTYEVDVGYPDDAAVYSFTINNDFSQAMSYNFSGGIREYNYDISDDGNLKSTLGLSKYGSDWWTKMTEFPISATLKTRGLIIPIPLMTYIKVNCTYFGVPRPSTGVYIVVGQTDDLSSKGFSTTLNLLKVAGENQYINLDGRVIAGDNRYANFGKGVNV